MGLGKYTHPKYYAKRAVNWEGQERAARRASASFLAYTIAFALAVVVVAAAVGVLALWSVAAFISWVIARLLPTAKVGSPARLSIPSKPRDERFTSTVLSFVLLCVVIVLVALNLSSAHQRVGGLSAKPRPLRTAAIASLPAHPPAERIYQDFLNLLPRGCSRGIPARDVNYDAATSDYILMYRRYGTSPFHLVPGGPRRNMELLIQEASAQLRACDPGDAKRLDAALTAR
jgi:hypothetical protein